MDLEKQYWDLKMIILIEMLKLIPMINTKIV